MSAADDRRKALELSLQADRANLARHMVGSMPPPARLNAAASDLFQIVSRLASLSEALHAGNSAAEQEACKLADSARAVVASVTGSAS